MKFVFVFLVWVFAIGCSSKSDESPADLFMGNSITLKKGETFSIKLSLNGSIGYSNCWMNQSKCKNVEVYNSYYVSSQKEKEGFIGSGGYEFWMFKAIKEGVDTLHIRSCPTGLQQKSCSDFSIDSSYNMIKDYSKVGRTIIVQVLK